MYRGLRDHTARRERELPGGDMAGCFMVEGKTVIGRAIRSDQRLASVLVDARAADREWLSELSAPVLLAGPRALTEVCGRPRLRDPIGCFVRPEPFELDDVLGDSDMVAVLEGVANPTNVGMIMRNAAALGVDAVLVDPTTCDPLYRRAVRVSMGEVFAIPHARVGPLADVLRRLAANGFTTVGLTPDPEAQDLRRFSRRRGGRIAVLVGTEGAGLSKLTLDSVDHRLRIPMSAGVDSLNVATAAALAFYGLGPSMGTG